jgi:signal transduction histidine kinase
VRLLRLRPWPRSLAARTALVLLLGLALVQGGGLLLHALDSAELQRIAEARDLAARLATLYRAVAVAPAEAAPGLLAEAGPGLSATLGALPAPLPPPSPFELQRLIRPFLGLGAMGPALRPRETLLRGTADALLAAFHLPDGRWLAVHAAMPDPRPWNSPGLLALFLCMTGVAALLAVWAVRRLTKPVRALAAAAERLGRDVNAPALPEDGPSEVASAAAAFNRMAARIRRFVDDRTFLLAAIGHDLRTPITRLKLRAELLDDDEQRRKWLADLDELEAMVNATLAFSRDVAASEPAVPLDLAELVRTVLDEAADTRPALADRVAYAGPEHLAVQGRPVALKRALANLVGNALAYGAAARARLDPPRGGDGIATVSVEDDGPGLPAEELERVFEPFRRGERSRSRETGGSGLGLAIARNILRAHGGEVTLANRPDGGLRAVATIPA